MGWRPDATEPPCFDGRQSVRSRRRKFKDLVIWIYNYSRSYLLFRQLCCILDMFWLKDLIGAPQSNTCGYIDCDE